MLNQLNKELDSAPKLDYVFKQYKRTVSLNNLLLNQFYCTLLDKSESSYLPSFSSTTSCESSDSNRSNRTIRSKKRIKTKRDKCTSFEKDSDDESDNYNNESSDPSIYLVYDRHKRHAFAYLLYKSRGINMDLNIDEQKEMENKRIETRNRKAVLEECGDFFGHKPVQTSENDDLQFLSDTLSDSV